MGFRCLALFALTLAACSHNSSATHDAAGSDAANACVDPATDCGTPPACQVFACNAQQACEAGPDLGQNGAMCGTDLVCKNGECISATCGNAMVEANEECDFGTNN